MASRESLQFREQFLEDSRLYMLSENKADFMYRHVGIAHYQTVLDVGCGTGYFTRHIARFMQGTGHTVGTDLNPNLLVAARRLSKEAEISNIDFREADALDLPYGSETFDLTICHFLLSVLHEPIAAIKEMTRVTKTHGRVAAVEPCLGAMTAYYADQPRLSDLLSRIRRVKSIVQWKLKRINENIGAELPRIFRAQGLSNVQTEILAMLWWSSPPFHSSEMTNTVESWYKRRMLSLSNPGDQAVIERYGSQTAAASALRITGQQLNDDPIIAAYEEQGISAQDLLECRELRVQYLEGILKSKEQDKFVEAFEIIPVFAVTGVKNE
jgi:ubiquinone/menaquinone biosynthesis C-methylase UbiE